MEYVIVIILRSKNLKQCGVKTKDGMARSEYRPRRQDGGKKGPLAERRRCLYNSGSPKNFGNTYSNRIILNQLIYNDYKIELSVKKKKKSRINIINSNEPGIIPYD